MLALSSFRLKVGLAAACVLGGAGVWPLDAWADAVAVKAAAGPAVSASASDKGPVALPVVDPMEMVRERLKEKLRPKTSSESGEASPPSPPEPAEDLESLAMERLRARLSRRLGVDATATKPNELRLTTRVASPAEVEAARIAANTPHRARPGEPRIGSGGAGARTAGPGALGTTGAAALASAATPSTAAIQLGQPWSYEGGNGPHAWARLKPEYAICGSGKRQSPIDLRDGIQVNLEPLVFNYAPSALRVVDDGRSLSAQVGPGNTLSLRGRRYELQSVQFHTPAEEHVQGKVHDMSAEFLHKDAQGHWLVVSVLLDRGPAQAVLQAVLDNLPLEKGDDVSASQPVDWSQLLPGDPRYFIYMGSLSSPPCTEGVVRIVMKTPMTVSAEQFAIFSRLYPMNARPTQPAAGRVVKESS